MVGAQAKAQIPNCRLCSNFFITYEPYRPNGCKAYGFKSAQLPTAVVLRSSGLPCRLFEQRKIKNKKY
jgi:hypothetical protein